MLSIIKQDCRSTTGRNLRKLMLFLNKTSINDISKDDFAKLTYNVIPPGEEWKINLAKEIIDVKNNHLDIGTLDNAEADDILEFILT